MNEYLQELITKFHFDRVLREEVSFHQWLNHFEREEGRRVNKGVYNDLCASGYFVAAGASRIVIGHEDLDYVFKIVAPDEDIDYCANEVFVYNQALRLGYGKYFAACSFFTEIFNTKIYIMERCVCDEEIISSDSYNYQYSKYCQTYNLNPDSVETQNDFAENSDDCSDEYMMLELAEAEWETDELTNFLDSIGVNDCHAGNWGRRNGELVLVDYAGYGEGAMQIAALR